MTASRPGTVLLLLLLTLVLALSGCGGGASVPAAPAAEPEPAGPGRLLGVRALPPIRAAQIAAVLATAGNRAPALTLRYDVANYRIEYLTLDADGREVRASGLLSLPIKGAYAKSPLLSYQHGTIFEDAEAPSNAIRADAPPIVMASVGYLVVSPDYVGYGASKGVGHPYLLAAPAASAVIDLLTAARTWRLRNGVQSNGQLFLVGYSEGGYVTLAAQRAIEAGSSVHRAELVGSVPGAGPYHVAATLDALLQRVKDESPALGAFIDPGFLRHMPGLIRVEVRRALVRMLVPGDTGVSFDSRFIDAYFEDDRDRIERESNVHDWKPLRAVRLMHGRQDRTVPYVSASTTLAAMRARGATEVSLTECTAVPSDHLECVPPYLSFMVQLLQAHARDL